jgi:hypothetical protein
VPLPAMLWPTHGAAKHVASPATTLQRRTQDTIMASGTIGRFTDAVHPRPATGHEP